MKNGNTRVDFFGYARYTQRVKKTLCFLTLGVLWAGPLFPCVSNFRFSAVTDRSVTLNWDDGCTSPLYFSIRSFRSDPLEMGYQTVFLINSNKTTQFLWTSASDGLQPNSKMQFEVNLPSQVAAITLSTVTAALPPISRTHRRPPLPLWRGIE